MPRCDDIAALLRSLIGASANSNGSTWRCDPTPDSATNRAPFVSRCQSSQSVLKNIAASVRVLFGAAANNR